MSVSIVSIIKNTVFWILGLLLLALPLLLLFIWKNLVILFAKLLRPSLKPFSASDIMLLGDRVYKRPLCNIGLVLRAKGELDIAEIRAQFARTLLDPKDSSNQPVNMNLFYFPVRFGGYSFKERVTQMNLENQIYETTLKDHENFSDFVFKFFQAPFVEGEPLWNLCLLPGIDIKNSQKIRNDSITTLLFRLHHSMGDGYSLIYLFDKFTNTSAPILASDSRESICNKVKLHIIVLSGFLRTTWSNLWKNVSMCI
jgi:hypothetical protein